MSDQGTRKLKLPNFRREERHEFRYQLSIGCATALSWFCWILPPPVRMLIADMFGALFFRISPTYRENVLENVRKVLGPDADDAEVLSCVKSIFRTSSRNFVDLLMIPRLRMRHFLRMVDVREEDWQAIEDARALGNGVILLTGHVGCFDLIAQVLKAKGFGLTIVTGRTTSRFIFDGVTHLRSSQGNVMVEPTPSGVRHSYRALRRNECAVFVTDRDFFQNGRSVEFFGQATTLPPGAIRIARETGAVVLPLVSRRIGNRHQMRMLEPFVVERTSDIDHDLDVGMRKVASALEEAIRPNIRQWAMFQRVWPEHAPGPVQVFPVGSPLESPLLERVASALPERKPRTKRSQMGRALGPIRWVRKRIVRSTKQS